MAVDADIAALRAQVEGLGQSIAHQWTVIEKLSDHEKNDKLILYKLEVVEGKLDAHDTAETKRSENHDTRITKLESARDEFSGTFKAMLGGVTIVASVIGGIVTFVVGKLFTGSVH